MRKLTIVLAFLPCVVHGRQDFNLTEHLEELAFSEDRGRDKLLDHASSWQPLEEVKHSGRQLGAKRTRNPLKLLILFLTVNPAAQQISPGQVQQLPPWLEYLFNAEILGSLAQAVIHFLSLSRFPPVTCSLVALNVLVYLVQEYALSVYKYGLQPSSVWKNKGRSWQLLVSSFLHIDLEQLIIDMCSLLVHGTNFEELMRPRAYLKLIAYATTAPNMVLVLATRLFASRSHAYHDIYTDFSGALSCLATVWRCQVMAPMRQNLVVYGISLPSQYAWLELVIQKLLNPGVSVLRQVSGLVAGVIYVYLPRLHRHTVYALKKLSPARAFMLLGGLLFLVSVGLMLSGYGVSSDRSKDLKDFRDALNQMQPNR